jgi:NADPH-dependent 2,4-dienoyl-CoA reductase/sulfur reductase-like enzyme
MFLADGANVTYAAEIKKQVRTPVATVGALGDPALMEEIIASGKADVVLAARALLADPDLPRKARGGKADEVRPCQRCFECFSGITTKRQYRCAVNPEIGNELACSHSRPSSPKKRVLVAGGGVAGMQAALTAAERGHEVILCEKGNRLGGALRCEEMVPFKKHLSEYLDYLARMLSRAPVAVHLGAEVSADTAKAANVDAIIAALGARPVVPEIPGISGNNVLAAETAYYHPERVGGSVAILGGGLAGIELAIYLSGLGRICTIVEQMDTLSDGGNPVHGLALINEIKRFDIQVSTATKAVEISAQGIIGEHVGDACTLPQCSTVQAAVLHSNSFGRTVKADAREGSRRLFQAETVVYAAGQHPLHEEADALRFCAPVFHQIGDCLTPRNIQQATAMAFAVAQDL